MFMLALLMDEMDYEDTNKFRELYKSQLDPEHAKNVAAFSKAIFDTNPVWKEASMYPGLFTRGGKLTKAEVEADYLNPSQARVSALIMKAYFVLGRWALHPKMSKTEYEAFRQELSNYVTYTPEVVKTFMSLLVKSEPSNTMRDCDVWKCAKMKSTQLQAICESREPVSETEMVTLHMTEWPFPNYASRKLPDSQQPLSQTSSQSAGDTFTLRLITLDDLKLLMGWMIRPDICGQCNSSEVRFACAFHRIYLCDACRHMDCTYDIAAGWEISDRFEVRSSMSYDTQTATIALLQLLGPQNPRATAMAHLMVHWPGM